MLPDATTVGPRPLTVADRERSRRFYQDVIGLREQPGDGDALVLGAEGGVPLLVLTEEPGAQPMGRAAGLFHFAILLPERADLARWLVHGAKVTHRSRECPSTSYRRRSTCATPTATGWSLPRPPA